MLNLDNIKYKNFKVGNLFLVEKCKCNKAGDLKIGNIPYIGATNRNNGLMSFVNKENKLTFILLPFKPSFIAQG